LIKLKKITLSSLLIIILCGASSFVFAHTTIKDQATEGVNLYTADTIAHGCRGSSGTKPYLNVIGQSIVFPNGPNSIITRSDNLNEPVNLGDVLVGGQHSNGIINPGPIQSKDVFDTMVPIADETQVVRAIHYTDGDLPEEPVLVTGVIPFKFSGVTFVKESCVTKVNVRIAIADWCTQKAGERRANVWIGRATPLFNGSTAAEAIAAGFWPTLIINRDLKNNPLPANCGEGYEVTVEPSDEAIDQYLPMPGFIP
jgi:hypothetical protein